jgi:aminodeoxyfutalosine deaminase
MATFRARYVFPVDRPPIEDGAVAFETAYISAVGRFPRDYKAIDLGDVAIVPGFVNAHTHLEFSDLEQPLGQPGMSLPGWIREVIACRRASAPSRQDQPSVLRWTDETLDRGLQECYRFGVTTIGDITTDPSSRLTSMESRAAYLELRAVRKQDIEPCLAEARSFCLNGGAGLSPHAPYTVNFALLEDSINLAREYEKPLVMHLAESREELQLLATSRGPYRDLLEERQWWEPGAIPLGARPLDYLQALASVDRSLVIHGNYLDDEEIAFLAANKERMSVLYCPRTHAYFRHDPYPLRKMLDCGVRVAIGTDSRASNPDLDLRKEMQFVIDHHHLSLADALRLGTIESAAAMGLGYLAGTISNGKAANLTIIQLPGRRASDPHELLFGPDARVVATICRGRVLYSDHPSIV